MSVEEIAVLAYADFRAWIEENDPLEELSIEDQAEAYCRARTET